LPLRCPLKRREGVLIISFRAGKGAKFFPATGRRGRSRVPFTYHPGGERGAEYPFFRTVSRFVFFGGIFLPLMEKGGKKTR